LTRAKLVGDEAIVTEALDFRSVLSQVGEVPAKALDAPEEPFNAIAALSQMRLPSGLAQSPISMARAKANAVRVDRPRGHATLCVRRVNSRRRSSPSDNPTRSPTPAKGPGQKSLAAGARKA
jgi:hypothetical protein